MSKPLHKDIHGTERPALLKVGDICFQCNKDQLRPARNDMLFCVRCNEFFDIWDYKAK